MQNVSLLAAGAIIASAAHFSVAGTAGSIYSGLDIGYELNSTGLKSITKIDNVPTEDKIKTSGGRRLLITSKIGYQLTDAIRADLAFTYLQNQKVTDRDLRNVGVKRQSWFVMTNITYSFLNSSNFEPFVGVGIGYGSTTFKMFDDSVVKTFNIEGGKSPEEATKKTKKGLVYGAALGVSYKVNDRFAIDLSYALQALPKGETKEFEIEGTRNTVKFKTNSLVHSINVGARFHF